MNLIEQLGGYEAAKNYLAELQKIPMHEQTEDTIVSLPRELLEYRREHNIFEVGDIIAYNESDFIYKIDTLNRDGLHATTVHEVRRSVIAIFGHDSVRHATDEEIANNARSE